MQPESSPGVKLRELIEENGQLVYDPDKTLELLTQACPGFDQEVQILVAAQRASLPWEMLNLGPAPQVQSIEELVTMLESKTGMPTDVAHWAVQNWAYALDINISGFADPHAESGEESPGDEILAAPPVEQPVKPAASPNAKFYVLDGPNRWGPVLVETLNDWARQGRLHGRMLFEDAETHHQYTAVEVPGLFIPAVGSEQPHGAYFRAPSYIGEEASLKRKVDGALIKSTLLVIFCCIIGGGISLILAIMAKVQFSKGQLEAARSLTKWADIVFYVSIPIGLVAGYYEVLYFIDQYHRAIGMMLYR